ncbi:MAG: hypothetical protein AMJ78_10125 [Omnitrophica WOR_2 bacterium SM23_29]|nr:MAG: hypothetical protein AMJ78_10125 [Omnitrophica WOR_2 bacterium SM23_29]
MADNRYTRAKRTFKQWIKDRILVEEKLPAIYIYDQEYIYKRKRMKRLGFISLAKLEEQGPKYFLPHERTFAGPKEDRFRLMKEVRANLSPIFSVFSDDGNKINQFLSNYIRMHKPIIDIEFERVKHKVCRMSDKAKIMKLVRFMRDKQALIADGHHRYEVALKFRNLMRRASRNNSERYDYVMMYFATSDKNGLTILPTHRMVEGISKANFRKNMAKLKEFFDIIKTMDKRRMFTLMGAKDKRVFGVYLGGKDCLCLLLKKKAVHNFIRMRRSAHWKNLDVVILHNLILEKAFGIKGKDAEKAIYFTRDSKTAFDWVDAGKDRAAFFLNPPRLEDVKKIAQYRERMPHKTTYFYPKPLSGLVINKLE